VVRPVQSSVSRLVASPSLGQGKRQGPSNVGVFEQPSSSRGIIGNGSAKLLRPMDSTSCRNVSVSRPRAKHGRWNVMCLSTARKAIAGRCWRMFVGKLMATSSLVSGMAFENNDVELPEDVRCQVEGCKRCIDRPNSQIMLGGVP
jgi:hypothetical protein